MDYSLIPQAMFWKYGARCSKNASGTGIDSWQHESLSKPGPAQINAVLKEYEAHLKATAYIDKRKKEYPSIEEQLDAIWKGGSAMESMRRKINAVKSKFPKPNGNQNVGQR